MFIYHEISIQRRLHFRFMGRTYLLIRYKNTFYKKALENANINYINISCLDDL